jgi:hypothetical protein
LIPNFLGKPMYSWFYSQKWFQGNMQATIGNPFTRWSKHGKTHGFCFQCSI